MTQHSDMPGPHDPEIFRRALEGLSSGIFLLDRQRKIFFWNEGAQNVTGFLRHEVVGHTVCDNILAQCNGARCAQCGAACPLTRALHEGKPTEAQVYLRYKTGDRAPAHLRANPIRDSHGSILGVAASFEEQRSAPELGFHVKNLAAHGCLDVTSGVPNHAFTQSHLRENLAFFEEYRLPFGILRIQVLGLDDLKTSHGREAADVMVHVLAQTMKHALRPDGFLGRWSESQFLAIVTNCGRAELERAAQNVQEMVNGSGIQWWDDVLSGSVRVGSAMVQIGDTLEGILERAGCPAGSMKNAAAATSSGGQNNAAI